LGAWTSVTQLEREFDRFGAIKKIEYNKGDIQAFIQYDSIDAATAAVKEMRGFTLGGPERRLRVDFADVPGQPTPGQPGFRPKVPPGGAPPYEEGGEYRRVPEYEYPEVPYEEAMPKSNDFLFFVFILILIFFLFEQEYHMDMPHAVIIVAEEVTVDVVCIVVDITSIMLNTIIHIHIIHVRSKKNIGAPHQNTWNTILTTRSVVLVHANPVLIVHPVLVHLVAVHPNPIRTLRCDATVC
jgi:RNA recognition motif. (a.k.a. RRM, RBD, or RNP domain)